MSRKSDLLSPWYTLSSPIALFAIILPWNTPREGVSVKQHIHIFSEWNGSVPTLIAYKPAVSKMIPKRLRERFLAVSPASKVFRLTNNYRFLNQQFKYPSTGESDWTSQARSLTYCPRPPKKITDSMSFDLRIRGIPHPIPWPYRKQRFHIRGARWATRIYARDMRIQGFSAVTFICAAGASIAFGAISPAEPENPGPWGGLFRHSSR
jgi:hypothetical protein